MTVARAALRETIFAAHLAEGRRWSADEARGAAGALVERTTSPRGAAPTETPAARAGLTTREVDVLRLVAAGKTNAEIGEALFISAGTARVHVSSILAKLGAKTRTEAADLARRQDIL